jgi:hypothetical protein
MVGLAREQPGQPRRLTIDTTRSPSSYLLAAIRVSKRRLRDRLARP